jgi:hypothetical protein
LDRGGCGIHILPFVRGCLLETNKENYMKMRLAILAVCASTLVLAPVLATAEAAPSTFKKFPLSSKNEASPKAGIKKSAGIKDTIWADTDINRSNRMGGGKGTAKAGGIVKYDPSVREEKKRQK